MKKLLIATLAVALAGVGINSHAGTDSTTLDVSGDVIEVCTISTTAVAFDDYTGRGDTLAVENDGAVKTVCTFGTDSGVVTLSEGVNKDGSSAPAAPVRRMKSGSNYIFYSLSSVSNGGAEWGDTAGTGKSTVTGTGEETSLVVYGQIPAGQKVPLGTYSDIVTATITW